MTRAPDKVVMLVLNPCVDDSRVIKQASALVAGGYRVSVVCTSNGVAPSREVVDGVEYIRIDLVPSIFRKKLTLPTTAEDSTHTPPNKKTSRLLSSRLNLSVLIRKEIVFLLKFWLLLPRGWRTLKELQPDIIHCHDLNTLPTGAFYKLRFGAKLIYDAHELEQHRNPPLKHWQRSYVSVIERFFSKRTDMINTVSDDIAEFLSSNLNFDKVNVIYNSPARSSSDAYSDVRTASNIEEGRPLLVYVGGVFQNRGVDSLLRALELLEAFHLAVVGKVDFKTKDDLAALSEALGISDRVHFLDPVKPEEVVGFIRTADIGVFAIKSVCLSYEYCMPNKLFEMAFAGLPIAASNLTSVGRFLDESRVGITFDPESVKDIADKISWLYSNKADFMEDNSMLLDKYSWEAQSQLLFKLYRDLHATV